MPQRGSNSKYFMSTNFKLNLSLSCSAVARFLGLEGEHQRSNAALALQVARCWLQQKGYQGKWTGQWVGRGQVDLPLRALRGEDRAH